MTAHPARWPEERAQKTVTIETSSLGDRSYLLVDGDVAAVIDPQRDIDRVTAELGACNPQLAHRALQIDPRIATLLPCNVVVRTENGRTVVEALDPRIIAEIPGNPALAPIAEEAGQRINAALDALGNA